MGRNLDLFGDLGQDKLVVQFIEFHERNPHVYSILRRMALRLRRAGRSHYGIAALYEVMRFEMSLKTDAADCLKLNNNHAALYARLLEQSEPELRGFFSMRERRARGASGQIVEPGDMAASPVDCFDQPL